MRRKIILGVFFATLSISTVACGNTNTENAVSEKESEAVSEMTGESTEEPTEEITVEPTEEITEESEEIEDESETEHWWMVSCSDFQNGIAFVDEEDIGYGETRTIAIDTEGNELFVVPEMSAYNLWNVDINGEYVWCEDTVFNRSREVINDISDKYSSFQLGNGYVLVKEISSGYEQKIEKMGVIDGYGNEIIPISEELSELLGEELLNIGWDGDYSGEGIGFGRQEKLLIDANQGTYYKLGGGFKEYRNGNVLTSGNSLYKNNGTSKIVIDDDGELTLSEEKIISLDQYSSEEPVIRTYDLEGNLLNEAKLDNLVLDNDELKYDNGSSALYIKGMDGYYVTMIDEYGNFKFEPIKHQNHISDQTDIIWSEVSEGLLRVALDEYTTVFVNEKGEQVLEIPYPIEAVGNCKNGRIAINTGERGFYVDAQTGEYILY